MNKGVIFKSNCIANMSRENKELLVEMGYEDAVILEDPDYDSAIVGVSESGRVIYDYDKMVEWLMETDGMTQEDAVDFIDYNTIRALPYFTNSPIIMYPLQ